MQSLFRSQPKGLSSFWHVWGSVTDSLTEGCFLNKMQQFQMVSAPATFGLMDKNRTSWPKSGIKARALVWSMPMLCTQAALLYGNKWLSWVFSEEHGNLKTLLLGKYTLRLLWSSTNVTAKREHRGCSPFLPRKGPMAPWPPSGLSPPGKAHFPGFLLKGSTYCKNEEWESVLLPLCEW